MSALAITTKQGAAPAASTTMSLAAMCAELECLLDTAEMVQEGTADRAELDAQIAVFETELPAKVDRVNYALAFLESTDALAASEIKRLQARRQRAQRDIERLEQYCVRVIERLPDPKKGKRKLEGNCCTLSLRPSEGAIVTDEAQLPAEYFSASVKLPALTWWQLVEAFPELADVTVKLEARLSDIKAALKSGQEVAGADLEFRNNLRRS